MTGFPILKYVARQPGCWYLLVSDQGLQVQAGMRQTLLDHISRSAPGVELRCYIWSAHGTSRARWVETDLPAAKTAAG